MDLVDAIDLILADNALEGGYPGRTDEEVIAAIRKEIDHDEVDLWVEFGPLDLEDAHDAEIELAYRVLLDATDEEVAAVEI